MSAPYPNFGELLPGGSSKTQRDKAKKRRWLSRSDEEIAEHMDSRNLPYRKGWPQLPPLPVSNITTGARNTVNNPQAVIEMVQVLCQAQNVQPIQIYFAFRVPEVQQVDEQYHTLVVTVDFSDDPILFSLIIQIRKHLQQDSQHQEISIEIIDHRVVHGLFSFAIPPSEEHLLSIWQPAFDIALEEIRKRKEQWLTIEMLYRGLENNAAQCPATVVITSPSAAEDIWYKAILPDIHKRVLLLSPSLKIELLCGSSLHSASQASRGVIPDADIYQQYVPMGSSIGQRGIENHSGTAGGMVKLSDGATCALTNHHVVRNDALDSLLTIKPGDPNEPPFLKPGNPAFDPNKHRFTCPSDEDNTAFVQEHDKYEKYWLTQAEDSTSQQQLASIRAELTMTRTTDRAFGTVYASSGLRTVICERFSSNPINAKPVAETGKPQFHFILDWCLLAFHPARGMSNLLPARKQYNTGGYSTLLSGQKCSRWTVMNNPKCHILSDEVSVGKFGRTTGFTYGKINAIPTVINPEAEGKEFKFIAETYGFTVKDCGHSMSFVAHKGAALERGDSGSIVLHAPSGDWLGLIFGETRANAALFTPIDLVFRDIEKVTGHKVIEPVFNSN